MKKSLIFLMLFVMGIVLCSSSVALAEDPPEEETPELFDSVGTAAIMVFDIGAVNLTDEPEPEPEPEPDGEDEAAE